MDNILCIEKVLSWERLLRLVPERDLRSAAALKPASRREEFLMWRSIVYRRLPDAEIAYNAVGFPSYAIIPSISEFPTAPDTLRSVSPTVHVPSISSRLPAISVGRQPALLLPKSGSCPTVRCCCRPSGAPRRRFTNIRGGGTSICSGIVRIERFDPDEGRMTGRICGESALEIGLRREEELLAAYILV